MSAPARKPWHGNAALRLGFLRELQRHDPQCDLRASTRFRGGVNYGFEVKPPSLVPRRVELHFSGGWGVVPHVFVDRPHPSPHRYSDGSLCMWHPDDPEEGRWWPRLGASVLVGHINAHLIKEEWWDRTGEWPGAESDHSGKPRESNA